jgi:hypothetical protein
MALSSFISSYHEDLSPLPRTRAFWRDWPDVSALGAPFISASVLEAVVVGNQP